MPNLFEESAIKTLILKNRFVRAATWEGLATPEGAVSPELTKMMVALAKGGVGLIISDHAYVSAEGQTTPRQLGVDKDSRVVGLREITTAVHQNDGKIILQLAHAGQYAKETLTGTTPLAVSDACHAPDQKISIATIGDIEGVIAAYAQAAGRALAAGFDGIELHAAHGYFLSQFLSPATNCRRDAYGGSIANRALIHRQICRAMRAAVGEDFPILIKMNSADDVENGLTLDESV